MTDNEQKPPLEDWQLGYRKAILAFLSGHKLWGSFPWAEVDPTTIEVEFDPSTEAYSTLTGGMTESMVVHYGPPNNREMMVLDGNDVQDLFRSL